jgi:predicted ATPase/class 3 adenylate cyclase
MTRRLVAILSADAVGYSRLMAADEAAALRQVDAQRALLRERIEAHGGRVVDAVGDNLLAELPSAVEAVACAVEAQRALALRDEALPTERRLELRIGIHVGDVIAEGDRIAGDAVNVAARIEALAPHGGVALSGAAYEQVVGKLDISFDDLGERVLKNLARPVRVHRVAGLGRAIEPSAPLAAPQHNLPEQRTRFVGREAELSELEATLEGTRLLTLTGIGGAGKSRLSLELARRTLAKYPDGVRLAELASQSAPEQVAAAVSQALGVPASGGFGELAVARPPEEELIRFLGERALLLLIDNCEHLVGAVAALADLLLARCPFVTILATSQEPLGVPGEQVWQVPPLGVAGALLFGERAAAVRAGFRPAEHAAAIEEICERLDGIPLAIELAAARVAHLTPREIAARLGDRFKLLASRERSGEKRHATLRATLDWSHELLEEPERALLRRLSVFCDPFTLDAAESVCAEPPLAAGEVLDLLASLVRRSLVVPREQAGETRYRLLESVRQYAAEKLAHAGETERTRDRHADWVLALARLHLPVRYGFYHMPSEDPGELLRSISDFWAAGDWALEREDVERAPELIARSGRLAVHHSRVTETLTSIERALALPELPDSEWRFQLRYMQSQLLTVLGRFAEAFRLNESLISELRAAGRHQPLSAVLIWQAISSASTGLADPFPLLGSALEAARAAADPELEVDALAQLGGFQLSAGHYAEAVATVDRAAALTRRGEPRSYVVASLQALAAVLSGDFERAGLLARISEPTRWSSEAPDPSTASTRASWLLASAASGDLEATAEQLRALVRFQRRVRAPLFDADLLGAAGAAACLLGDFERAGRLLGAARSEFGRHGSWRTQQGGAIYVHFTAQVRRALPADVAKRARDEGHALSVEQAFELALAIFPE